MSSNSNPGIRSIIPGGPEHKPNITGDPNQLVDSHGTEVFTQGRTIDKSPFATPTTAEDTMTGSTSADVYTGYGHPGGGISSQEHHDKSGGGGGNNDQWGAKKASDLKSHPDERQRDFQV